MKFSKVLLLSILVISSSQLFSAEDRSLRDLIGSFYGVNPDTLDIPINYVMRLQALNDTGNATSDAFKSELNNLTAALFLDTFNFDEHLGASNEVIESAELIWHVNDNLLQRLRDNSGDEDSNRVALKSISDAIIAGDMATF